MYGVRTTGHQSVGQTRLFIARGCVGVCACVCVSVCVCAYRGCLCPYARAGANTQRYKRVKVCEQALVVYLNIYVYVGASALFVYARACMEVSYMPQFR